MQVTLDAYSLKPFTKALTCLSRYGDDLSIYATPDNLSISATNSSMSAYCRFKYSKHFFSRFRVGNLDKRHKLLEDGAEEDDAVTGQLLIKPFLSILKHRTIEKTAERCELSIVEGLSEADQQLEGDSEERDTLESKLIVRLYCKHGVIKTHNLLLLTQTSPLAPDVPDAHHESRLTIGPRALKDMIENFPSARTSKNDPQLIWTFDESEVIVKTLESSIHSKGKSQLSTEVTISADEFDTYEIHLPPITIAFHLREFNATIAFAESMSLPLDLRFTEPSAPLIIDIEGDSSDSFFVISTSHLHGSPSHQTRASGSAGSKSNNPRPSTTKKRVRDADSPSVARTAKPVKAVHRTDLAEATRMATSSNTRRYHSRLQPSGTMAPPRSAPLLEHSPQRAPLFLPGSPESVANSQALVDSGLGLEDMGPEELTQVLEGEGEEVVTGSQEMTEDGDGLYPGGDSFELVEDVTMAPTQVESRDGLSKTFRPLFQD